MLNHKLIALLVATTCLTACGTAFNSRIDRNCPPPNASQLNKDGYLMLQDGSTLKCQVKNYTSRMSCSEITDQQDTALVCNNGTRNSIFVFGADGILKSHKTN